MAHVFGPLSYTASLSSSIQSSILLGNIGFPPSIIHKLCSIHSTLWVSISQHHFSNAIPCISFLNKHLIRLLAVLFSKNLGFSSLSFHLVSSCLISQFNSLAHPSNILPIIHLIFLAFHHHTLSISQSWFNSSYLLSTSQHESISWILSHKQK